MISEKLKQTNSIIEDSAQLAPNISGSLGNHSQPSSKPKSPISLKKEPEIISLPKVVE
jgi:hypothetical protein